MLGGILRATEDGSVVLAVRIRGDGVSILKGKHKSKGVPHFSRGGGVDAFKVNNCLAYRMVICND